MPARAVYRSLVSSGRISYFLRDAFGGISLPWTGATWSVAAGTASNTPTLGSELIVNGAFGADTDWSKGAGWAIAAGVTAATAASADISQTVAPLAVGTWYQSVFTLGAFSLGTVNAKIGTTALPTHAANGTYTETGLAATTAFAFTGTGFTGTLDNASVKALTLSTLFRTLATAASDTVTINADLTIGAGTQAGLVLNLNSASSPSTFILAYHDGVNAQLWKCISGTYTNLISAAATYSAAATLQVLKNGSFFTLKYNGAQVGAVQIVGGMLGTIHGMFSTVAGNLLDNFSLVAQ
jgi:hypothetical protein